MTRQAVQRQWFRAARLLVGDGSPARQEVVFAVDADVFGAVESRTAIDPALEPIDLGPGTVLPGLIDAHVHLIADGGPHGARGGWFDSELAGTRALNALAHAQAALRAGFTTLRDLGGRDYVDVALRDAIAAGTHPGPRLLVSGYPIGTTGGHFDHGERDGEGSNLFDSPDGARAAARAQVKMGVDWLKIASDGFQWGRRQGGRVPGGPYREMTLDEMRAVCEVARDFGIHVAVHTDGGEAMHDAVRAGVRTVEHIKDLSDADVDFLAEHGVFLVPTLAATHHTLMAGEAASGLSPERFAFFVRQWDVKLRSLQRAVRAGVQLVLGTDAGYALCRHGASAAELPLLVEAGLSPLHALAAAASVAADAIGAADQVGQIKTGLQADFIVVDGDPVADIALLTRPLAIQQVYKAGARVA